MPTIKTYSMCKGESWDLIYSPGMISAYYFKGVSSGKTSHLYKTKKDAYQAFKKRGFNFNDK